MCADRVAAGMLPACVKTCPTGGHGFGERDEILALAKSGWRSSKRLIPRHSWQILTKSA